MTVCASCGTEVDQDAIFCPTCGQPIRAGAEPELPPAPDWPAPPPRADEPMAAGEDAAETRGTPSGAGAPVAPLAEEAAGEPGPAEAPATERPALAEPSPVEPAWEPPPPTPQATSEVPPWRRGVAFRPAPLPPPDAPTPPPVAAPRAEETTPSWRAAPPAAAPPLSEPVAPSAAHPASTDPFGPAGIVVLPETIAGWLMSTGALLGLLALFLPWRETSNYTAAWGLASGINIVVGIALLAVLVVLLAPHWVPAIPRRDLVVATIGLVGVGIGLDRLGLPLTGMGATVFLIAMILVAGGGLMAELGIDRPTGGMRS